MRKNWSIWVAALAFILVLSACSGDDDNAEPEDVKGKDSQIEEKEQKESESSADETEEEKTSEENEENDEDKEDFSYDTLIELGFDIFEEQTEEDYDFLESVLSEGSSVNKDNNTLQFDNVTYPHEYEFISKEDYQVLSERYVNGNEKEGVTIGYDVTDFETESSYVIDTEFI